MKFRRFLPVWLALAPVAASAQEEYPRFTGVLEHYLWSIPNQETDRIRHRSWWAQGTLHLSPMWSVTAGYWTMNGAFFDPVTEMLDENFVKYSTGDSDFRFGRFRKAFGYGDWTEWYSGFVRNPIIRVRTSPQLTANGLTTGMDASFPIKGVGRLQAGVLDESPKPFQWGPRTMDHVVARLEIPLGPTIVGLNSLSKSAANRADRTQLYDVDFLLTQPGYQVKGEYLWGDVGNAKPRGHYLDLYVFPKFDRKVTLLARHEGFRGPSGDQAMLATTGAKYTLTRDLILEANYSWGSKTGPGANNRGWSFQVITFVRF
ncbi:MAG: hypothetical protein K8H99_12585 [Nitrospirae bacterium]|nr:hypothetical protein [Fimbriimonadaceae bacterium]